MYSIKILLTSRKTFAATAVLTPLLGVTWILIILVQLFPNVTAFSWMAVVSNSLQVLHTHSTCALEFWYGSNYLTYIYQLISEFIFIPCSVHMECVNIDKMILLILALFEYIQYIVTTVCVFFYRAFSSSSSML